MIERTRTLGWVAAMTVGLAVLFVVGLSAGSTTIAPEAVLRGLAGSADEATVTIVRDLRAPRMLQAALVGLLLATSGGVLQTLFRNPLADSYVLGVASGAAVGAVTVVASGLSLASAVAVPLGAAAGAFASIGLVLTIAGRVGGGEARGVLLSGVIVGAFCNAVILLALSMSDADAFRSAVFWMMGSNASATWASVTLLAIVSAAGLLAFVWIGRALDVLRLGDESAMALGVDVKRISLAGVLIASGLTAAAVAASGVIGFVGLLVPHIVRRAWGGSHRRVLALSAVCGAAMMVLADTLSRTVAAPSELPVGAVTALVGAPFFLHVLKRRTADL